MTTITTTDDGLTVYRDLVQRSDEWRMARAGIVTASVVGKLLTVSAPGPDAYDCPECGALAGLPCVSLRNGADIKTMHGGRARTAADNAATAEPVISVADNDTSRGLITTLAAERITRRVEDGPTTPDMWRGIISEPYAIDAYAEHHAPVDDGVGFMVRRVGAIPLGYSPDGLVGDDGLIEIKAPRAKGHITTVLDGQVPAQHMAQIQTGLLVSGRSWCDFISFNGGMHLYVDRVEPDPAWQAAIVDAVRAAERALDDITDRYAEATAGLPLTDRIPDLQEVI